MAALMTHLSGAMEPASIDAIPALLDELDLADGEHTNVGVQDETGWSLSLFPDGLVVWEHLDADDEEGRLAAQSRADMLTMCAQLVAGDVEAVANRPWVPRRA